MLLRKLSKALALEKMTKEVDHVPEIFNNYWQVGYYQHSLSFHCIIKI